MCDYPYFLGLIDVQPSTQTSKKIKQGWRKTNPGISPMVTQGHHVIEEILRVKPRFVVIIYTCDIPIPPMCYHSNKGVKRSRT